MHVMRKRVKRALCAHHFDATLPRVEDESTPGTLGDQVARQLKRLRETRRLPYTELSDRLTALGYPIPVLGLRRIERGERRVDVDELAALALALNVPPLALLFPLTESAVQAMPGWVVDTWAAAKWFTGEATVLPVSQDKDLWTAETAGAWWTAAAPMAYHREHDRFVERYDRAVLADDEARIRQLKTELLDARRAARKHGYTPPPLVGVLEDIEDIEGRATE